MKVTEIGTKVKQKIRLVADHLKSSLTCPKYKFVLEMLAGIISTGDKRYYLYLFRRRRYNIC